MLVHLPLKFLYMIKFIHLSCKTLICDNVISWMLQCSVFHEPLYKDVKICGLDLVDPMNIGIKKYLSVLLLDGESALSFLLNIM